MPVAFYKQAYKSTYICGLQLHNVGLLIQVYKFNQINCVVSLSVNAGKRNS